MTKQALLVAPGNVYKTMVMGRYAPLGFSKFNIDRVANNLVRNLWDTIQLVDTSATKRNVIDYFDNLIGNNPDEVLLYYCGHGDFTDTSGRDEATTDGDEFLVLYDPMLEFSVSSEDLKAASLLDDDLTAIVDRFLDRNIPFNLVLDCCYANGMIDVVGRIGDAQSPFNFFASSTEDASSFAKKDTSLFTEALMMASAISSTMEELKDNTITSLARLKRSQVCSIRLSDQFINSPKFL